MRRCLIVRTAPYDKDAIAKVLQLRANIEGLKLGDGVLNRLSTKGVDSSLRYVTCPPYPSPRTCPSSFMALTRHV